MRAEPHIQMMWMGRCPSQMESSRWRHHWPSKNDGQQHFPNTCAIENENNTRLSRWQFSEDHHKMTEHENYIRSLLQCGLQLLETDMLLRLTEAQGQQPVKCLEALTALMSAPRQQHYKMVKSNIFYNQPSSPDAHNILRICLWMRLVKNMRFFLPELPKKWYELCLTKHNTWLQYRQSFLTSSQDNQIETWDKAIFFKFKSGSTFDYFRKKERCWLHVVEPNFPKTITESFISCPRVHNFKYLFSAPPSMEDLLDCMQDITVHTSQSQPLDMTT